MGEHKEAALQRALACWPQWAANPPVVVNKLNSGTSHTTYLLAAGEQQFVLRLDNPHSRELAMSQQQEVALMRAADSLAPPVIWTDSDALVTGFVNGSRWQPPRHLPQLCAALKQLHALQPPLPAFDLARHCDSYWQKILSNPQLVTADTRQLFHRCRALLDDMLHTWPAQVLCHNDLNPDNIFCHEGSFVFLDWEYACYNSPYFELATLVELFQLCDAQAAQLSTLYWQDSAQPLQHHLEALQAFRLAVRFTEWLWRILKQDSLLPACELRLKNLLQNFH